MSETKERIKSVLIVVLIFGMLYLTYSVWFFDSPFGDTFGEELFGGVQEMRSSADAEGVDLELFGVRPLGVMIRENGASRGAVYDSAKCDEIYSALRDSVAKVTGNARSPELATEDEWNKAILSDGVFFDYFGNIPVEAIKLWLGNAYAASDTSGRYFMFSAKEKNITLYVKNTADGTITKFRTNSDSKSLMQTASAISASPVKMAAEFTETDFLATEKEMLVPEGMRKFSVLSADNMYARYASTAENACLEAFRLDDVTPSTYSEADGTAVYIADMITLKISPSGIASYSDPRGFADETLGISVKSQGHSATLAEKTESARLLCERIAVALGGKGGIYLMNIAGNGEKTELFFGRHVGGVPVNMNGSIYFAKIDINGNYISAARLNLRGYEVSAENADVLSVRLAAAAVSGANKSGDMVLRYTDDGNGSVLPSWFIRERKKDGGEDENELVES